MESNKVMETELWAYIDNICDEAERERIAELIASDTQWKQKYEELLAFNNDLKALEPEHTSMRFSKNVMEAIADVKVAKATRAYVNPKVTGGIAAIFILLVCGAIVYSLFGIQWTDTAPEKKIDYSSIFNNNFVTYVVLANLLVGVVLVDTLIRRRKKSATHDHT